MKKYRSSSHRGTTNTVGTIHHNVNHTEQQLVKLAKLSKINSTPSIHKNLSFPVFGVVTPINYLI